jgi:glycerate kinase
MRRYADLLQQSFPGFDPAAPGMGAAGGMGAMARAFLQAELLPGIECVLDLVGFDELLRKADLCITGEGHADAQSVHGKVVSGVAVRCLRAGVPCVALVGGMDVGACELLSCGVDVLVPTVIDATGLEEALKHAEENFRLAAARTFRLLALGSALKL